MLQNIRDILGLKTPEDVLKTGLDYSDDLKRHLEPLEKLLAKSILHGDPAKLEQHMAEVESWRDRVARQLYIVSAVVEYGKSNRFALGQGKGVTESIRDGYRRSFLWPWTAAEEYLGHLIDSIDSRVNLCKKKLYMELEAVKVIRNVA